MKKFRYLFILVVIFITGFLIFSYRLGEVPRGVYVDEAAEGYNAYSILKTGQDEYGKPFPLAFRLFSSYTPPLYIYLTVIPVWFLGLNEYSIRVTSVICGGLMLVVLYFFLRESVLVNKRIIIPFTLLFIITPWNFFYSRIGYEIYLGFLLFSLGILFAWIGLKRSWFLPFGLFTLSVSTYAAFPQLYSVPIFIFGFLILFYKQLNKKFFIIGAIIAVLIQFPRFLVLKNILMNKSDLFYLNEVVINAEKIALPFPLAFLISFLREFFSRTISFLSPGFLFFKEDPDLQRSIPELSVFYNWMVIPYLIGIFLLVSNLKQKFSKLLILLIIASIIPAALTNDTFPTQRALNLLLPLFVVICMGLSFIYEKIGVKKFVLFFGSVFMLSLILLWRSYFVLLPAERAVAWSDGYKELTAQIAQNPSKKFVLEQTKPAYIELAFFMKLNPNVIQESADADIKKDYYSLRAFNPNYNFQNIEIKPIVWAEEVYQDKILVADEFVLSDSQIKEHYLEKQFEIKDPRGYVIFRGVRTNPQKKCEATNYSSVFCNRANSNTIN